MCRGGSYNVTAGPSEATANPTAVYSCERERVVSEYKIIYQLQMSIVTGIILLHSLSWYLSAGVCYPPIRDTSMWKMSLCRNVHEITYL